MCDHCVKRSKAYEGLPADQQAAADAFAAQAEPALNLLMITAASQEEFENAYIEFGDGLDTLLGIGSATSTAPDFFPADWADDAPDWADE
jgi:hypothetical protein